MRIVVIVEQVWDLTSIDVDPITGEVDRSRTVFVCNPADRTAFAYALLLKRAIGMADIDVYSVGPERVNTVLRECLALGASHVIRVWSDRLEGAGEGTVAQALASILRQQVFDLVLMGNRSADQGPSVLGPMLAEVLGLPQVTGVAALQLDGERGEMVIRRRLERGVQEELTVHLPALLCLEPGLAEPHQASLPALLAAQQASVPVIQPVVVPEHAAPRLAGLYPPRPRPHRLAGPDPGASVEARLAAILGTGQTKSTNVVSEGTPEELVERILMLLHERHFL
jgi:electron transfer flavoprotein beta subunit